MTTLANLQGKTIFDAGCQEGYKLDWCLGEVEDLQLDTLEDPEDKEFLRGVVHGLLLAVGLYDANAGRCALESMLQRSRRLPATSVEGVEGLADIATTDESSDG